MLPIAALLYGEKRSIQLQLCLQTGKGYLQPNDPFSTSSVVTYGLSAADLNMTATGTAQVGLSCLITWHRLMRCWSSMALSLLPAL